MTEIYVITLLDVKDNNYSDCFAYKSKKNANSSYKQLIDTEKESGAHIISEEVSLDHIRIEMSNGIILELRRTTLE